MAVSLINKLRETPLCFIDVETTGASAEYGERIVEMGAIRVENGQVSGEIDHLLDPKRRISAGVQALTGITPDMVAGCPACAAVLPQLLDLMRDAVVIGHNVRFDLSFLRLEFHRAGMDIAQAVGPTHVIDTLRLARRRFGRGGNGLQNLARRLGFSAEVAHRGLADVYTTRKLFEVLIDAPAGWEMGLCDLIAQQGGPMGLLPATAETLLPLEIMEALESRGRVRMEYVDACGERSERVIEPMAVKRKVGELVLVAHCYLRGGMRTFKLERIVRLERIATDCHVAHGIGGDPGAA